MKHVKTNPQFVFEEKVDFRSSTGKFSKPFRAAYALVYFPRKRKPYILDLAWLGRRSNEVTLSYVKDFLVFYYKEQAREEIGKEEAQRARVRPSKPTRPDEKIKKLSYTVKKTKTVTYSERFKQYFKIFGYNYVLKKPLAVTLYNADNVIARINKDIIKEATKLAKKNGYYDYTYRVKYFCSGHYIRKFLPNNNLKIDALGYSLGRNIVANADELSQASSITSENFLKALKGTDGRREPGYLMRRLDLVTDKKGRPVLDENGKRKYKIPQDSSFMITGFRLEFTKELG